MAAPGRAVARHQEANRHDGGRRWEGGCRGRLGKVVGCVLGAEVGEDGERGGLMRGCREETECEGGESEGDEEESAGRERGVGRWW